MADGTVYCPKCGKPAEPRPYTSYTEYGEKYESITCHLCNFDFNIFAYRLSIVRDGQGQQLAVFADNEGL